LKIIEKITKNELKDKLGCYDIQTQIAEKPIFDNMPTFTCIKLTNHIPSHNLSSKELLEQYNLVYQLWNKPAMFTHSKITSTQKKDVEEHYLKHHSYRYPKYYNADLCLYFYFFHFGLGEGRRA